MIGDRNMGVAMCGKCDQPIRENHLVTWCACKPAAGAPVVIEMLDRGYELLMEGHSTLWTARDVRIIRENLQAMLAALKEIQEFTFDVSDDDPVSHVQGVSLNALKAVGSEFKS